MTYDMIDVCRISIISPNIEYPTVFEKPTELYYIYKLQLEAESKESGESVFFLVRA